MSLDVLPDTVQNPNSPVFPGPDRWVFVYEKGYQTSGGLISSVSVKLKGLAVTQLQGLGPQVWDVADYVFPAQVSWLRPAPSSLLQAVTQGSLKGQTSFLLSRPQSPLL